MIAEVKIKEDFSCRNFLPILVTSAAHPLPIHPFCPPPSPPPALTKISPKLKHIPFIFTRTCGCAMGVLGRLDL